LKRRVGADNPTQAVGHHHCVIAEIGGLYVGDRAEGRRRAGNISAFEPPLVAQGRRPPRGDRKSSIKTTNLRLSCWLGRNDRRGCCLCIADFVQIAAGWVCWRRGNRV